MWVVYHLWSPRTPDWLRVIAAGLRPRGSARSVGDLHLEGRRVGRARGLRHVRDHLRGQPRPAPYLHAARLHELPAAQGLPAARRRGALARRGRPPRRADVPARPSSCASRSCARQARRRVDYHQIGTQLSRRDGDSGHDDRSQLGPLAGRSEHLGRDAGDHLRRRPALPAAERARGGVLPPATTARC